MFQLDRPILACTPFLVVLLLAVSPAAALPDPERWSVADPDWEQVVFHSDEPFPEDAIQGLQECIGGNAGGFACLDVDLYARLSPATLDGGSGNDIWGWTDPMTGNEYALMGMDNGTAFVDVSDPEVPIHAGNLPTHTGTSIVRDIKVYADHAFIIGGAAGHGMQVFDLTQLRDVVSPPVTFGNTAHYDEFGGAHNLVINEDSAFAYAVGSGTCSGGMHMIDISDPVNPVNAGCVAEDGYVHDAQCVDYAGPDVDHAGKEICLNCNEDTLTIVDVTDKSSPVQLSRTGYPTAAYTHQGWLTEDHAYFLLDDEGDEGTVNTRTYIWDVRDLDAPVLIGVYTATTPNTDHNQYVRGNYVYQANYGAGLRILKLDDVAAGSLTEVAFFDTDSAAWSVYPYFASGTLIVSDIGLGLFVLRADLSGGVIFRDGFESGNTSCWSDTVPLNSGGDRRGGCGWRRR